jgi:hypothetical protein
MTKGNDESGFSVSGGKAMGNGFMFTLHQCNITGLAFDRVIAWPIYYLHPNDQNEWYVLLH